MSSTDLDDATTRGLAEFAASLRFDDLPLEVVAHAKECLLDTLGCGLFGATLPWSGILRSTLRKIDIDDKTSRLWGTPDCMSAPNAALVNGAAVHAFELDDLHKESILHPGSVVAPVTFAASDLTSEITGSDLVVALVAGYEVGARVGMSVGAAHLLQGWHPTGTHGTLAAAAAASSILRLTPEQTQHALGIAGSQSAGLMASQFSSMVKRFHAGRAAQSGLYGALLAREGYTGITNLLESEYGGYCSTFSPSYDLSEVAADLGDRWEALRVGFKPYSTNGSCHPTIDLLRDLRSETGLAADDVVGLRIFVSSATFAHVGWHYEPDSVTTAQMNLSYIAAVVLTDGEALPEQFSESRIQDPQLVDLAHRVEVIADPEIDARGAAHRHATRVEIHRRDGELLRGERESARGSEAYPLTSGEVHEKFRRLASTALPPANVDRIEQLVGTLELLSSPRELVATLTP